MTAQRVPLWAILFGRIDMMETEELILNKVRNEFEGESSTTLEEGKVNVWVMALAIVPFENYRYGSLQPNKDHMNVHFINTNPTNISGLLPTHAARIVLRTTDQRQGINDYVDGTDIFITVNRENQTVQFTWEDLWAEGPPIFHGQQTF